MGVVLAAILAHGLWAHTRSAGRWGEDRVATDEVGAGAYRRALVYASRMRRAPKRVLWGGILTRAWAALTVLGFVPAGAAAVVLFVIVAEHDPLCAVFAVSVGALVISGLGLGLALMRAAHAVEHREEAEFVGRALRWSHGHHLMVAITFVLAAVWLGHDMAGMIVLLSLPPCLVGSAITFLLGKAARRATATD
jgi:hypothetical protein